MQTIHRSAVLVGVPLLVGLVFGALRPPTAHAAVGRFQAAKDNTLWEYHPGDPNNPFHSNGRGDFFAAGRTRRRSQIQRGLIQFDFGATAPNGIPAGATVTGAGLQLHLVDYSVNDPTPRPFWLLAITDQQINPNQSWGEGTSSISYQASQSGRGTDATEGDATWYHTSYDPSVHGDPPPTEFVAGGTGYWKAKGALGDVPYISPLPVSEATYVDSDFYEDDTKNFYTWSTERMAAEVQNWVDHPETNFGWILLGDESVDSSRLSSKREFASRESDNALWRPVLTVEYTLHALPGDLNGDSAVDQGDLALLLADFGADSAGPADGDLNGDGDVDDGDLNLLLSSFTAGGGQIAPVPEPSALVLAAVGLLGLLAAAHRKRENRQLLFRKAPLFQKKRGPNAGHFPQQQQLSWLHRFPRFA